MHLCKAHLVLLPLVLGDLVVEGDRRRGLPRHQLHRSHLPGVGLWQAQVALVHGKVLRIGATDTEEGRALDAGRHGDDQTAALLGFRGALLLGPQELNLDVLHVRLALAEHDVG